MSSSSAERLQFRSPPINLYDDGSHAPSAPRSLASACRCRADL